MKKGNRESKNNKVEVLDTPNEIVLDIYNLNRWIGLVENKYNLEIVEGITGINRVGNLVVGFRTPNDVTPHNTIIITIYVKDTHCDVDIFWKSEDSIGRSNINSYKSIEALLTGVYMDIYKIVTNHVNVSTDDVPKFNSTVSNRDIATEMVFDDVSKNPYCNKSIC